MKPVQDPTLEPQEEPSQAQTGLSSDGRAENDKPLVQEPKLDTSAVNDTTVLATANSSLPQPAAGRGPRESNVKKLIALLVATASVLAIATGLAFVFLDDGLDNYTLKGSDVTFGYPAGWAIDDEGREREVDFTEPRETGGEHIAEISVALIDEEALTDLGLSTDNFFESYTEIYKTAAESNENVELRTSGELTVAGRNTLTLSIGNSDIFNTAEAGLEIVYIVKLNDSQYLGLALEAHESDKEFANVLLEMAESIQTN